MSRPLRRLVLRARLLDSLRGAGDVLPLTWDVFFYTVILAHFNANYENPMWIPYRLSCTVVQDDFAAVIPLMASLGSSVLADLGAAAGQCAQFGIDLSGAQNSLANPDATIRGTAAYAAAGLGISSTRAIIDAQIGMSQATLQAVTAVPQSSANSLVSSIEASTMAAQQLCALTCASAYLGRAARNLSNAST